MKLIPFNYSTVKQADDVVVLCGGPSTRKNKKAIVKYVEESGAVVFSSNYIIPFVKVDYTYFIDKTKFSQYARQVNSAIIISKNLSVRKLKYLPGFATFLQKVQNNHEVYDVGTLGNKPQISNMSFNHIEWKLDEKGNLLFNPVSSGIGAMACAVACKPKRILVVGFDGPKTIGGNMVKKSLDGSINTIGRDRLKLRRRSVTRLIIPLYKEHNIEMLSFPNCKFWGLNKKKLGVRIIKG